MAMGIGPSVNMMRRPPMGPSMMTAGRPNPMAGGYGGGPQGIGPQFDLPMRGGGPQGIGPQFALPQGGPMMGNAGGWQPGMGGGGMMTADVMPPWQGMGGGGAQGIGPQFQLPQGGGLAALIARARQMQGGMGGGGRWADPVMQPGMGGGRWADPVQPGMGGYGGGASPMGIPPGMQQALMAGMRRPPPPPPVAPPAAGPSYGQRFASAWGG